jgi:hypothetical protein
MYYKYSSVGSKTNVGVHKKHWKGKNVVPSCSWIRILVQDTDRYHFLFYIQYLHDGWKIFLC